MIQLPANWADATVGGVCDLINGRAFRPSEWSTSGNGLPIVRIQNLRDPVAPYNRFEGTADDRHLVENEDVVFAWSGTPGTSFGAHVWSGGRAVLNQHIFKVAFDRELLHPRFLMLAMNAALPDLIPRAKGGAGLKHLTKAHVESIRVPIPPRAEQNRIVAQLDATVTPLMASRAELHRLKLMIPVLERACLAAAASGRFIDRDQLNGRAEARIANWPSLTISECGEVMLGRARDPARHTGPQMRPYLRVANVLEGRIDVTDVMQMQFSDKEFERYVLKINDILINEGQSLELVGRPAMFLGEMENCCFTNTLVRFRAASMIVPEFALLVFRHYLHSGRFRSIAKITTNLAHLGAARFASLQMPVPPIEEQRTTVERCGRLLQRLNLVREQIEEVVSKAASAVKTLENDALQGRLSQQRSTEAKPVSRILPASARRRSGGVSLNSQKSEKVRAEMADILTVVQALKSAGTGLSGQQLFRKMGYPEHASISDAEQFFVDLRAALRDGIVRKTGEGDGEVFALVEGGAS